MNTKQFWMTVYVRNPAIRHQLMTQAPREQLMTPAPREARKKESCRVLLLPISRQHASLVHAESSSM